MCCRAHLSWLPLVSIQGTLAVKASIWSPKSSHIVSMPLQAPQVSEPGERERQPSCRERTRKLQCASKGLRAAEAT